MAAILVFIAPGGLRHLSYTPNADGVVTTDGG